MSGEAAASLGKAVTEISPGPAPGSPVAANVIRRMQDTVFLLYTIPEIPRD